MPTPSEALRVILVAIHHERSPQAMPLGLACLATAAQSNPALHGKVGVQIVDLWPGENLAELPGRLQETRPDVLGFSVFAWNRLAVQTCIQSFANLCPETRIVLGGPESFDPALLQWQGVSAVIRGEGETAFCAFLQGLVDGSEQALGADTHAKLILGVAENLAQLPSPWLTQTIDPKKYQGILWELSRGCPFVCSYCFESRSVSGVRSIPLDRIQAELRSFARSETGQVFVLDPTFNAHASRTSQILALIRTICPQIHFHFEIRAEFLTDQQAQDFAQGPYSLQIGLQSAHPAVLEAVHRKFNPSQFRQRIALLNQSGAIFGLDLIYGLPLDTLDGFKASLDWALSLEPNHLDVFALSVLPGTQLAIDAPGFGLDWAPQAPYRVRFTPTFSAHDMQEATRLAQAAQIFYTQGRAVGWFKRVCHALDHKPCTLLGLFADFTDSDPLSVAQPSALGITRRQLSFLRQLIAQQNCPDLLAAIEDLVAFHSAWGALVAEATETRLNLNYDPASLNGPEGRKLGTYVKTHRIKAASYRFYRENGEPSYRKL